MIVAKKSYNALNYAAYDNYALDYKNNDYEEQERKDGKETRVKPKTTVKKKLKLVFSVVMLLLFGMLIVARYAMIMDLNGQSISLKNKISENQKINEELKLQLMGYCDIKKIEEYASSEIKMVRPESNNIVYINIPNTNKNDEKKEQDKSTQKVSLIDRIISFFE